MTNDPIERGLHRSSRDLERLQEVRADSDGHDNRDQNHFTILPPVRLPRYRHELVQFCVKLFGAGFDLVAISLAQRGLEQVNVCFDLFAIDGVENVAFITKVLLRMPQQQLAVFNMTSCEHELSVECRMSKLETIPKHEYQRK